MFLASQLVNKCLPQIKARTFKTDGTEAKMFFFLSHHIKCNSSISFIIHPLQQNGWAGALLFCTPTLMPTFVLCMSTRARRSLLERLPRNSLTNLLAYLKLSPQPPHCQALRFSRSGASSHVQRSMRPALQALANACINPAEEMAYKKAVSLNPGKT